MRVLVTNDDGIHEPGLRALALGLLEHGHDVVVAGPAAQCSGSAASLGTVEHEALIDVSAATVSGLETVEALAVQAPPALAVRAACSGALGPVPDVVVSGINPGYNTGRLVLHSGTVGAAATAASLDVCGIAVSTHDRPSHGFETAARVAAWVAGAMAAVGLPPVALNVNVPDVPADALAGVEEGSLGRDSISTVDFYRSEHGLLVQRGTNAPPFPSGTDSGRLANNVVSITSLSLPWLPSWDAAAVIVAVRGELRTATGPTPGAQ